MKTNNDQPTVGQLLSRARQSKNWSLEEAAHLTKLRKDILSKLESDRYDLLPSHAYARGFIRIYARELGLNSLEMIKKFDGMVEMEEEVSEIRPETLEMLPETIHRGRFQIQQAGLLVIAITVGAGLLLGMLQLYRIWPRVAGQEPKAVEAKKAESTQQLPSKDVLKKDEPEVKKAQVVKDSENPEVKKAETVSNPTPTPTPTPVVDVKKAEPVAVPVTETTHRLQLMAEQDCWVKVVGTDKNGKETVLFEDTIPAGKTIPPDPDQAWVASAFDLTIRDTTLVNIILDGKNYGKYDQPGRQEFRVPAN